MKKNLVLIACSIFMAALMSSCSNTDGYKKTEGGLSYKYWKHTESDVHPQYGDVIEGNLTIYSGDSLLFTTGTKEAKVFMVQKGTFKGDMDEILTQLSIGDSVSFKIPTDSVRKTMQLPASIGKEILYSLKLTKIWTKEELQAEMEKEQAAQREIDAPLIAQDKQDMANYIKKNKITVKPTASGLYFITLKKGNGPKVEAGKMVKINYVGKLLNGKIFDTNIKTEAQAAGIFNPQRPYESMTVTAGGGQVIPGFDEALLLMHQGDKARVVIPSEIAYGARGPGMIPKYSSLVFELEIVSVQ